MKKTIILACLVILSGCGLNATENNSEVNSSTEKVTQNQYVKGQIDLLQKQLENGEITEKYAQEKLKKTLKDNVELNDGSIESILKKLALTDPVAAKHFEEKIRENHPEEFEK